MSATVESGAPGTEITCECGHVETVRADGIYHVIPALTWHADPATSTVSIVERPRYICDDCWAELPDE